MSTSLGFFGLKPHNEHHRKMKAILDACEAANIDPPEEVQDFFDGEPDAVHGVVVSMDAMDKAGALTEYRDDCREGYDIEIAKLPPGIKVLRVYLSC